MTAPGDVLPLAALGDGLWVGRIWRPIPHAGPSVVLFDPYGAHDISHMAPTMSELLNRPDLIGALRGVPRDDPACSIAELTDQSNVVSPADGTGMAHLLAPCDLQVIKACGVTFAISTLERVIEERTRGDSEAAAQARLAVEECVGQELARIKPGSGAAERLKDRLLGLGMWSQYLEVALGPDAEVFTKASPLSAVGHGAEIGIHRMSAWNNPEPEVVLAVNSRGESVGATLGNDVNLRDIEGRSALLLGKAKDNNGACAIGPAIRLFDGTFSLEDVRATEVSLQVDGLDGFRIEGSSSMNQISRDPLELVRQVIGPHHQYPDGLMLFLGTMFVPIQDRGGAGLGFTHHVGDLVTISAPGLGSLRNRVNYCDAITPWTFGIVELFQNLFRRALMRAE